MTRDIQDRLHMFGCNAQVDRIALNMDQVKQYNPPPNPAKTTDSRSDGYIDKYGNDSWELDALEPSVIVALIECHLKMDKAYWQHHSREKEEQGQLRRCSDNWEDISQVLSDRMEDEDEE